MNKRVLIKSLVDLICVSLSIIVAIALKYDISWKINLDKEVIYTYICIYPFIYMIFKENQKSWRYTSIEDVFKIFLMNFTAGSIQILWLLVSRNRGISITLSLLFLIFATSFQLFFRYLLVFRRHFNLKQKKSRKEKVIIYGAGEAGIMLMKDIFKNPNLSDYNVAGMIDDDPRKKGVYFEGVKVYGNFKKIPELIEETKSKTLIIAIPSLGREKINRIVRQMENIEGVEVKVLPGLESIIYGRSFLDQVRKVDIIDLLGREEVKINSNGIEKLIKNKTVLVTGGAGSIGSELLRQISKYSPHKLIALDINENDLYFLELELGRKNRNLNLAVEIGNVRDREKIDFIFRKYKPEIVFHAAAHKHVPLMEHNPEEAIKNNIFGTKNLVESASKYKVERFVLISTDKAVNPTNIMGATKRACELIVEDINKKSNTKFMVVRFGNVLGSNGSVIPIFQKLIEERKNLTITHENITRYFMTIPEAAQLVIEACSLGKGGEVFVLDMGKPIRIIELARNMIRLTKSDVGIDIIGLRPGEKLYEELLYEVSAAIKTENKKIFIAKIKEENLNLEYYLEKLEGSLKDPDADKIKILMKEFIKSYKEPEHHLKEKEEEIGNEEEHRTFNTEFINGYTG